MKKTIFSGVKPTGIPHLGNYLGAITQWVENQEKYNNIFCIVDLHAITLPQPPKELRKLTYLIAATYLAAGIDPRKSIIFIQSQAPAHSELAWLLTTISKMGEFSRMTQFKDKSQSSQKDSIPVGLFTYPALMAADILLYQTNLVPVGDDQKQHVELTRDLAQRFNHQFGKTFVVPEPMIRKSGARIMALDNPENKMSKSANSLNGCIFITDAPDTIRKKIMRAVTDSGTTIKFDPTRKGLYNLLTIYQLFSNQTSSQIEKCFVGKGYGEFKKELADLIIEKLKPLQTKINYYLKNQRLLDKILADGAKRANYIANQNLNSAKKRMGLF
jgi:tryptophanyl-tRNA synthetase